MGVEQMRECWQSTKKRQQTKGPCETSDTRLEGELTLRPSPQTSSKPRHSVGGGGGGSGEQGKKGTRHCGQYTKKGTQKHKDE